MNNYHINPIDLAPFIGASQSPEGRRKKLIKLCESEAAKCLENGDMESYNKMLEQIKVLNSEANNNN